MTDWRLELPESRRRWVRAWLWSVAGMTLTVLVIGGITRLTRSGLSIVDWDPIMGVIPPLSDRAWREAFAAYQQFPEYQQLRLGMTLSDFKLIYFWEYLHRLAARSIGLVFLVPFVLFTVRGWFNRPLALRALGLFALGGLQGVMGWLMVACGLVDRPSVSHFRLAAHLSLAFLIFGAAVWLARELKVSATQPAVAAGLRGAMRRGLAVVGGLLALQVVWGAFVAGLKAGFFHNTFPLMGGRWVPADLLALEPALLNFVQNPATVQWTHRVLGTGLAWAVVGLAVGVLRSGADSGSRRLAWTFAAMVAGQYALGVVTLLEHVPVALGVAHQAVALLLFGTWVWWVHHVRTLAVASHRPAAAGEDERAAAFLNPP